MRIVLAAAAAIACNLYFLFTSMGIERVRDAALAGDLAVEKDLVVLALSFLLLIEGILCIIRSKNRPEDAHDSSGVSHKGEKEKPRELQAKLDKERQKRLELEDKLREEKSLGNDLQTALDEATLRLQRAEEDTALRRRDSMIDAEIVNLLGLFQEKGRFIDFVMEDIATYSDAQVGAVSRAVHQGCLEVLKDYFSIEPLFHGQEGQETKLERGFNPRCYSLLGSLAGEPPFEGKVIHRGWKTNFVKVPRVTEGGASEKEYVIAPTQVELVVG